ncbi:diol dehydratase reactivase ATPase-like domain-containing protein, partial [Klebsiella pneumoniae]|uniref:diol dehydratase reactivase ATPase-like domain-containing protein n=1 Tax=Klebsiella pneumoniae TaxID=573 RepID=UPI003A842388
MTDRSIPAGSLELIGEKKRITIDVGTGADAIMAAVNRVAHLSDAMGESGTNAGGMIANVRHSMAELSNQSTDDVHIRDLLAVDTTIPQEVRGGLAGEVALENAVALAAM